MSIIVISGPSGVGKDSVVTGVLKALPELKLARSLTTRAPRTKEVLHQYVYVSRPEFEAKIKQGELLEWEEYNGNLYGTLRHPIEESVLLVIEVHGAARVKRLLPETRLVFLVPPGGTAQEQLQVLEERLRHRATDTPAAMRQRLAKAEAELRQGREQSDVVIVNDDLQTAIDETTAYIQQWLATQKVPVHEQ